MFMYGDKKVEFRGNKIYFDGEIYKYCGVEDFYASKSGKIVRYHESKDESIYFKVPQLSRNYVNFENSKLPEDNRYYLQVGISRKTVKGKYINRVWMVHQLVAKAWLGMPPYPYCVVHHKNHKKTDNRVCNLAWVTRQEHAEIHRKEKENR